MYCFHMYVMGRQHGMAKEIKMWVLFCALVSMRDVISACSLVRVTIRIGEA